MLEWLGLFVTNYLSSEVPASKLALFIVKCTLTINRAFNMNYLTVVTTLPGHEKKIEFQLVLWASSFHISFAQGHFLLVSVNDFIRG